MNDEARTKMIEDELRKLPHDQLMTLNAIKDKIKDHMMKMSIRAAQAYKSLKMKMIGDRVQDRVDEAKHHTIYRFDLEKSRSAREEDFRAAIEEAKKMLDDDEAELNRLYDQLKSEFQKMTGMILRDDDRIFTLR